LNAEIEQTDRDFAEELIRHYGEDRFYHSCKRTAGYVEALWLRSQLTGGEREESARFLASIGIRPSVNTWVAESGREAVCRVAYGLVRYYKDFALKEHKLPPVLNARMILGESNEWVRKYSELLQTFPDWNP
jgi:hypothetical protein